MTKLEDIKSTFGDKLDQARAQHEERLEAELKALRESLLREVKPALPEDIARRLQDFDTTLRAQIGQSRVETRFPIPQARVEIGKSPQLKQLDTLFAQAFNLGDYYPPHRLDYPTVYCETLEEFFTPIVEQYDLSPETRQAVMQNKVQEAREAADKIGGGIFGYNLPGDGCYLNGWLFIYGSEIQPRDAFQVPKLHARILETAVHEKLGHGFLGTYSALGVVKTELGLTLAELARKFGLRTADNPQSLLRAKQSNLVFIISQLLEEGWATWVESYFAQNLLVLGTRPRHSLKAILKAIQEFPPELPDREQVQGALLGALEVLLGGERYRLSELHQAVIVIEVFGSDLDGHFYPALGQPLRYAVGELLCLQAEANLGAICVPYAVLIAANVTIDMDKIGLVDLRELVSSDPRLHPDARLAAISQLYIDERDSVIALAQQAEAELSFSIPRELKK